MPKELDDKSSFKDGATIFIEGFKSNVKLALGKFLLVFPTQPMQVIMRKQQGALADKVDPRVLSVREAAKKIYTSGSYSAFLKGLGPAASKEALKNVTYKGLFISEAPKFANQIISFSFPATLSSTQHHVATAILAAFSASSADVIFGSPLETWAVHSATAHGPNSKSFLEKMRRLNSFSEVRDHFYRGAGISLVKGQIAFTAYFIADKPIKNLVMNLYQVDQSSKLGWDGKFLAAFLTGATVAVASSPFDIVKTHKQKADGPITKSSLNALRDNCKKFGIRGATTGLAVKFGMITAGWGVVNIVLPSSVDHASKDKKSEKESESSIPRLGKRV